MCAKIGFFFLPHQSQISLNQTSKFRRKKRAIFLNKSMHSYMMLLTNKQMNLFVLPVRHQTRKRKSHMDWCGWWRLMWMMKNCSIEPETTSPHTKMANVPCATTDMKNCEIHQIQRKRNEWYFYHAFWLGMVFVSWFTIFHLYLTANFNRFPRIMQLIL